MNSNGCAKMHYVTDEKHLHIKCILNCTSGLNKSADFCVVRLLYALQQIWVTMHSRIIWYSDYYCVVMQIIFCDMTDGFNIN